MLKKLLCLIAGSLMALQAGEIMFYQASEAAKYQISAYTYRWEKDSNLKPVTTVKDDILNVSYEGDKGCGRVNFQAPDLSKLPEEATITGFQVTLDTNAKEFDKLQFSAVFSDRTDAQFNIALAPGMRTYTPNVIFRRSKTPINWRAIKTITMDNRNKDLKIQLKKIALTTKDFEFETAIIPIQNTRQVHEVLPEGVPGVRLGPWTILREQKTISAADSPVQMQLSYTGDELIVNTANLFETPPLAAIEKHDDHVFSDEALELLFSPWLDNRKFMQFTINAKGTIFDMKYDFDMTAAGVIYNKNWSLEHKKELSYKDKQQNYQLKFPFSALGFSPSKERFINFQAGQHYDSNRQEKTLSWNPTDRFPNVRDFGVLVFNRKPFGKGQIQINDIYALTMAEDLNRMIFRFNFTVNDLPPGEYQLKLFLTTSQGTVISKTDKFNPTDQQTSISINTTRQSGLYTAYLVLVNASDNWNMTAVNYSYSTPLRDRFGETLLCPMPKDYKKSEGEFDFAPGVNVKIMENASERTQLTLKLFKNELAGYVNMDGKQIIELKINPELKVSPEGYNLKIDRDKITITGVDEPGLYYGTRTLMQLIKGPMRRDRNIQISCAEIVDYPDIHNRIFRICHQELFPGTKLREFRGVEYMLDYFERLVANQKYNILQLDLTSMTQFKRQAGFNREERVYTLEDWKKIAEFCRERFIELIPAIPAGSHEIVWLLSYYPKLKMQGWHDTGDVRNPEHNKIVFDCIDDLLDATGAKRLSPKFDEWYHRRNNQEAMLSDQEYYDAFWNFMLECYRHLKNRDVQMVIFGDMLNPNTNGSRFGLYKGIDQLPRDVIILHWGGSPVNYAPKYFTGKGFEIWNSGTSFITYNLESRKLLTGFGASPYSLGKPITLYDDGGTCTSSSPIFQSADYAWNLHRESDMPTIIDRLADGTIPNWRGVAAERPDAFGGSQIKPVDLSNYYNCDFKEFIKEKFPDYAPALKTGNMNIGNIPTKIDNKVILLDYKQGVNISYKDKASSLTFLLGAWHDPQLTKSHAYRKKGSPWRFWIYSYPAGDFIIHYQDDSSSRIPMRLYESFNWLNVDSLYRSTSDNRYVLPVESGDGRYVFLYQYEWINPHPERQIKSIEFKPFDDFDFKLLLFSVSARNVR